jgi:hypothetical protein
MSYPQISEQELRRRLAGLGYGGAETDRLIAIWEQTGMTVDEVLNLRWEDIDFEAEMMRVPDLSSRVYGPGEEWLEARAFEPSDDEEEEVDLSALPESALERVLPRERPELMGVFEPNRGLSRQLDVFGQAMLVGWLELAMRLSDEERVSDELVDYSTELSNEGYEPADDLDPDRSLVAIAVGTTVNGVLEDLGAGGEARLQDVADLLGGVLSAIDRQRGGNPYGEAALTADVFTDVRQYDYDFIGLAMLFPLVPLWQRLFWFAECAMRRGAVLAPGRGEPLVGDEEEQLTYLIRLGGEQPGLAAWPELARFVPRRADGLLPMTEEAYQRFRRHGIAADPELAARLAEEIVERRHYTLSTVSVIELEELGIRRIVLTPEEQPLPTMTGEQAAFHLGFFVDHAAGGFYGRATVFSEPLEGAGGRRALVAAPAILQQAAQHLPDFDGAETRSMRVLPPAVAEAIAAVELIVLSAWRDLVVPEVRDQHYEIDRIRKAKGKRPRATKRGDIEIIRYVPRRLLVYREQRDRAATTGGYTPRRLYPVGAFSRRLPEGQRRSPEAEQFAKESGIPLAPWQTVVRPHWRGGTAEERERAAADPELDVRHWRSWSAIDLLRTRLAVES